MAHRITRSTLRARLGERGIRSSTLELSPQASIVVSERGGRVYGPFFGDGPSQNWLPAAFAEPDAFAGLLGSGQWNLGGDRIWIGPEIAYIVTDRDDYWNSFEVPAEMDPGGYALEDAPAAIRLRNAMTLTDHLAGAEPARVEVTATVSAAPHPLREVGGTPGVEYGGYAVELTVAQPPGASLTESWMLNQMHPGGTVLIPAVPGARVTDYYEPVAGNLERVAGGIRVQLSAAARYKIGFLAAHHFGRFGYLRRDVDGTASLIVKSFHNDPSSVYGEQPDFLPGHAGDSIHLFNDDGSLGGFGELECRGRSIGGATGRAESVDLYQSWWFRGPELEVLEVAEQLLSEVARR